jgi:hypothetical protein
MSVGGQFFSQSAGYDLRRAVHCERNLRMPSKS